MGAMLYTLWFDAPYRPTRDMDLLDFGPSDIAHLEETFRALCEVAVEDDGLTFLKESVRGSEIRGESEYQGVRMQMTWANGWDPGQLPLATAAYEQAITLAPHSAMLQTAWGRVDLEGARFPAAAAHFRRAVELDATDGRAWAHLGEAELAQGRAAEALPAFREAVHWEPELSAAHAGLAWSLWLQGQRSAAEAALARALDLDPGDPSALALHRELSP